MEKNKRKRKKQKESHWENQLPILQRSGPVNFFSAGDRTEQTEEGRKKRKLQEDVFIVEDKAIDSSEEMEIKEGLHKDFSKSKTWGSSHKMMEKMGWKPGEGLGKSGSGKLNPIVPDTRYNSKMGLGTSMETRQGIEPAPKKESDWTGNQAQLPSYLIKKRKDIAPNFLIPDDDVIAMLRKFKMKPMDLNINKKDDKGYENLVKIQLKNRVQYELDHCYKQIYQNGTVGPPDIKKIDPKRFLKIGHEIHKISLAEAYNSGKWTDIELYKIECSRLWRHIDKKLGLPDLYLWFLAKLEETYCSQQSTGWGSPLIEAESSKISQTSKPLKHDTKLITTQVVNLSSSDEELEIVEDSATFELFGQKSLNLKSKKKQTPKIVNTDVIVLD